MGQPFKHEATLQTLTAMRNELQNLLQEDNKNTPSVANNAEANEVEESDEELAHEIVADADVEKLFDPKRQRMDELVEAFDRMMEGEPAITAPTAQEAERTSDEPEMDGEEEPERKWTQVVPQKKTFAFPHQRPSSEDIGLYGG